MNRIEVRRAYVALCIAGIWLTMSTLVHAQEIPGYPPIEDYDPREVALLPEYCKYTQVFRQKVPDGSDQAAIDRWSVLLGPSFNHLHHYCWGLMKANRGVLLARDQQTRLAYLNESIRELDYVLQRATPGFVLLPEIRTKKGEDLVRIGKGPLAVLEFERAIELKSDYWPAYAQLSDYYVSTGDAPKARETLIQGIEAAPNTPALSRRLADLESGKGVASTRASPRAAR